MASTVGRKPWRSLIPQPLRRRMKRLLNGGKVAAPPVMRKPVPLLASDRLSGRLALVTGGSGVIGGAICRALAAEGATVLVCGTSPEKVAAMVAEIREAGGNALPAAVDLTDDAAIIALFGKVEADHGRLDILVTCAGGSARGKAARLSRQSTEAIDAVLDVNLRATILCVREAARLMEAARRGRIITISSVIGTAGKASFSEYAAAKAGVIGFTRSMAIELGPLGITANCVSPGIVHRGAITPDEAERLARTNWLNSYSVPEDVGSMVAYLASEEAAFITGQNLVVDGGRSLGLKGDG